MSDAERLDEIRRRAEAATSGPWEAYNRGCDRTPLDDEAGGLGLEIDGPPEAYGRGQFHLAADAQFIAHARSDVPYLLAALDAMTRRAEAAERRLAEVQKRSEHDLRQERERRESLERRHTNLQEQQRTQIEKGRRLEVELDALLRVWCSGSCGTGVLRWIRPGQYPHWRERRTEVTEEIVAFAERNTRRLRQWFENNKHRGAAPAAPRGDGE